MDIFLQIYKFFTENTSIQFKLFTICTKPLYDCTDILQTNSMHKKSFSIYLLKRVINSSLTIEIKYKEPVITRVPSFACSME